MSFKHIAGFVGLGLSTLLAACSTPAVQEEAMGDSASAATASGCTEASKTACTPAVGSDLRKEIADLLRFSIKSDLAKNGVAPADKDITFTFKTMLIQNHHVYVAARIMRADGTTAFDLKGTEFDGFPNTVQALLEVESGSEFAHRIGEGLDPAGIACDFVEAQFDQQAPGIYQGDMKNDCGGNDPVAADDYCLTQYVANSGECAKETDDAAFEACLGPAKEDLAICCEQEGGSAECANP